MMRAIVLAGGNSVRYGSNKLLADIDGSPMFTHILDRLKEAGLFHVLVVTQYEQIADCCKREGIECVLSSECRKGASYTVKEALNYISRSSCPDLPVLFTAADQPYIKAETLRSFALEFEKSGKGLASFMCGGKPSNPAVFTSSYFGELMDLEGDIGGRPVINRHIEDCFFFEAAEDELKDLDFKL